MRTVSTRFGRRHKPCSICKKSHPVWWNSAKGRWFLSIEKTGGGYRQVNLGDDHDKALEKWHRIEAGIDDAQPATPFGPSGTGDAVLIGELAEAFLINIEPKISPKRFSITKRYILEFMKAFGGDPVAKLRIGGVAKIEAWLQSRTTWGSKGDAVSRIKQLFNWSVEQNYLSKSPVAALARPEWGKRFSWFTPEQVAAILANSNEHFARGFRMLLLTGCRPDEICTLTAANFFDGERPYLLVKHKNQKHTGKPRKVLLVPEAAEIVREQVAKYPTGRLFRSGNKARGGERQAITDEYFNQAMRDICRKPQCAALGLDEYEIVAGKRRYTFVPYTARHTFAVRYLTGFYKDKDGRPIVLTYGELAELMGNSAEMVEKVYGHLGQQADFLSDRMNGLI
jgi:integrase